MWILNSFYRSLFDIAWIREGRDRLGRAFGYALVFLIIIYGIRLIQPAFFIVPQMLETTQTEFIKNTPDFTATWKDAKLSVTGIPQPYTAEKKLGDQTLFVLVDTVSTSTPSIESLVKDNDARALLLVTSDNFSFYNPDDKKIETESFVGMTDDTVTKADVAHVVEKIKSYGRWLSVGLLGIGELFFLIGKLLGILILSLVVYILVRIRKFGWTYKQVLASSLYAMTLPTIIATTCLWLGIPLASIGTIVFFVLMYLAVAGFDNQEKKV